jgi:M6 family metalloprotease-like protein
VVFYEDTENWYYARATHEELLPTGYLAGAEIDSEVFAPISRSEIRHLIEGAWRFDTSNPASQGPMTPGSPALPNGGGNLRPGDVLPTPSTPIQTPQTPARPILPPGAGQSPELERPPVLPPTINNIGLIRDASPVVSPSIVQLGATSSNVGGVSWAFAPGVSGFPGQSEGGRDEFFPGQQRQNNLPDQNIGPGMPRQSASNFRPQSVTADNQPLLVVMVGFDNLPIRESEAFYHNKYFGTAPNTSTVANFYRDMSGGRDIFVPAGRVTNGGTFDANGRSVTVRESAYAGVVHVTVHTGHPITNWARYSGNPHISTRDVLNSVASAIHQAGFNFTNVTTAAVFAGGEGADNYNAGGLGQVWAHAWSFAGSYVGLSGWMPYVTYGETQSGSITMGIGTPVHELGHVLGLPDLYDLFGEGMGLGPYSIMAHGNWSKAPGDPAPGHTPTPFDAWSLIQLGFINPIVVEASDWQGQVRSANQNGSTTGQDIVLVASHTCNYQFFLIENRQMTTRWDAGLYGWFGFPPNAPMAAAPAPGVPAGALRGTGGLLIYHVDIRGNEHTVTLREADGSHFLASMNSNWNNFGDHFHSAPNFPRLDASHFYTVQGVSSQTNLGISTPSQSGMSMDVHIHMGPAATNGDRAPVSASL